MTKLPEPDTKRRRGADGFGETNWQTNCLTDRLTDWLIDWLADWLTVHQLLGLSSNGGASDGVCDWTLLGIGKRDWTLDATWTANISIRFPAISIQTPHTHTDTQTLTERTICIWVGPKIRELNSHTHFRLPKHTHSHTWQPFPLPHAWRWQRQTKQERGKTSKRVNFEVQRPVDTLGYVCHLLNTIKISLKYQQGYFIVSFNF